MSRPVLYPLRPLESATVRYTAAPHHRRRVTIDHRPLSGITPAMLLDWFTHIGGTMAYGGEIVDRYLAWHPIDHIYWGIARPAPGRWRRRRRPVPHRRGVRRQTRVPGRRRRPRRETRRDGHPARPAGRWSRDFQLEHTWSAGEDGAHYVSVMDTGARSALMSPINRIVCRRFPDEMVRAWVRHNIEEVGQLEYLLPQLKSGEAEPAQRA